MNELYGMTFEECVQDYVDCLNKAPNGWGQNYSEKAGFMLSHNWLITISERFGKEKTDKEIDRLLRKIK